MILVRDALRFVPLVIVLTTASACVHPLPNPGAVVLTCTMDAVKDPALRDAIFNALAKADFASAIASLINPALGVTAEVVACVLHSFLGKLAGDPANAGRYQRARQYLESHGYAVPGSP